MTTLFEKFKNMEMDDKSVTQSVNKNNFSDRVEALEKVCYESNLTSAELYQELLKQKQTLVKNLFENGYAPMAAIEEEYDLALEFMKNAKPTSGIWTNELHLYYFANGLHLFQLLIDLYLSTAAKYVACSVLHSLKGVFEITKFDVILKFPMFPKVYNSSYGTLVVTETADMHCALDEIVKTFRNLHHPWRIRKILVQECVKEKFMTLLEKNLPKIDALYGKDKHIVQEFETNLAVLQEKGVKIIQRNSSDGDKLKATLAFGVPMSHLSQDKSVPIIAIDTFRTAKEGVALANKEGNGEFVSVWSENVTEAFEYAKSLKFSTVWTNCYGVFHPKVPFTVNDAKFNFALYSTAVRVQRKPVLIVTYCSFPDISPAYQQSFFENNFFYTVTSEKRKELPEILPCAYPEFEMEADWVKDGATMYNYEYKSIIVRYGQTFAN